VRPIPERCKTPTSDALIVLSERRSAITFKNTSRRSVVKIVVDGCAITDGPRCDYLVVDADGAEYYIELKGCDVRHAIEQLKATIEQLSTDVQRGAKHCFVVCTRVAPYLSTEIQQAKLRFLRDYSSSLLVKSTSHQVSI